MQFAQNLSAQLPFSIDSFTPKSGPAGTSVTISGKGFSKSPSLSVYFGTSKSKVTQVTDSSIVAIVPVSATFAPISLSYFGTVVYSASSFDVTFPAGLPLSQNSFNIKTDSGTRNNYRTYLALGDLDTNGKNDVIASDFRGVSVLKSISQPGVVSFGWDTAMTSSIIGIPYNSKVADFDGDGKPDFVTVYAQPGRIEVHKNTWAPWGSISFADAVRYYSTGNSEKLTIGDIDGDGKTDVVVPNWYYSSVSIFKNESAVFSSFFFNKSDFIIGARYPSDVCLADLNGDKMPEMIVTNEDGGTKVGVFIYRNTSTAGTIRFGDSLSLQVNPSPRSINVADIDGDEKPDVIVTSSLGISVFRNTSTTSSFSFSQRLDFQDEFTVTATVADIDGDGKPDVVSAHGNLGKQVSIFKNMSVPGSISLAAPVAYTTLGQNVQSIAVGDLDGDSKPDILAGQPSSRYFTVLRNQIGEPAIIPSGSHPVTGSIVNRLIIDSSVQEYNGVPYVQRHYDIEPAVDATISSATITLYFTQQEFSNFNAHPNRGLSLPSGPNDSAGIVNLRIFQFHGFSVTSLPGNYSGNAIEINPDDTKIIWNPASHVWEVTFNVEGFSGFFVGTSPLLIQPPITVPPVPEILYVSNKCQNALTSLGKIKNAPPSSTITITQDGNDIPYNASDSSFRYFTAGNTPVGTHVVTVKFSNTLYSTQKDTSYTVSALATPSVTITASAPSACSGTTVNFTATPANGGSNPSYQWQVSATNTGSNSANFSSNSLISTDMVKVIMTTSAACVTSSSATSNNLSIQVTPLVTPSITISGTTTVIQGASSLITASVVHGGNSPFYQWQDSMGAASWTSIAGATNATLNYSPTATGVRLRCRLTSSEPCVTGAEVTSEPFEFTVTIPTSVGTVTNNHLLRLYPSPVTDDFIIDTLSLSDHWEELYIINFQGKTVAIKNIRGQTTIVVNVDAMPRGMYVAILRKRSGETVQLKFLRQ